jgi:hypothetical protein
VVETGDEVKNASLLSREAELSRFLRGVPLQTKGLIEPERVAFCIKKQFEWYREDISPRLKV